MEKKSLASPNRHERRRQKALARERAKRAHRHAVLHSTLLASATIGILATANLKDAQAQVVLNPPGIIPAQCAVTGGTAVCEGDLSAGLDADGPPLTNLTVQNLTSLIAPAAGIEGIDFDLAGDGNATLTFSAPPFGLSTTNADGIDVLVGGSGNITINSTGDITTQGASGRGIEVDVTNDGNVFVQAQGLIVSVQNSINIDVNGNGDVTILSSANITSGFDGIEGDVSGNGNVFIQSDGPINSTAFGIDANIDGDGTTSVISNGTITSGSDGIDSDITNGSVTILSTAQINAVADGIDAAVLGNGIVTVRSTAGINTTGNIAEGIDGYVRGDGSVIVHTTGPISTQGNDAEGIFTRVNQDGDISITAEGQITTQADDSEAIYGRIARDGTVTINTTGPISTQGFGADGIDAIVVRDGTIVINAIGAVSTVGFDAEAITGDVDGNGTITVTANGPIATQGIGAEGFDLDVAGNGDITVTANDSVTTQSAGADGVDATVGGNGDITVTTNGSVSTGGGDAEAIELDIQGNGTITVTANGPLSTTGDEATGIFTDIDGNGTILVTSNAPISTTGPDSDGIRADIAGTGGITVTARGNISTPGSSADGIIVTAPGSSTVNVSNSAVQGGTGDGVGVSFAGAGGSTNTLNTSGDVTLSALSGTAVNGGAGNTTINNSGTLNTVTNGVIDLGGGTNAFNNRGGGIFNSGGIVNLGAGNSFSNSGTFSPGAADMIQTTAITGTLVQDGGGILLSSVDPSAGTGDLFTVTETATLAGNVQAFVINPELGDRSVTILSAAGGTINNGLGLLASPALQASLSFPNANDVVFNYSIDFSAGGLNPNQTALAGNLNSAVAAGNGDLNPVVSALLNNVFTIGDYRNALNQLLPEVALNNETASLFSAEDFVDNLFSCRLAGQNHTALSEGECYWARPQGRFLDRDSDANTIGFDETSGGLAAGAQVAVAPNWFAGFALGYERASLDTDTGAEIDSNRFSGGLSLKFQAGSFLVGAAISGGVSGNDTQRTIGIGGAGGFNATADSNYAIKTLTGQARAAYVFQFRDWFAKPLVDVTATYLSRDGVTESGAGAANLALTGSDETFFSVTPALEIGGDFALSETSVIRPYVRAGVSFYTDSDHSLTANFVNAPAGTSAFSITSDFDDVFADVAAGATAFFDNGSTLGLSYEGLISSDTQQHGISLKGTLAF